jgi:hypothetical protein
MGKYSSPNAFIEKPINPEELIKTINELLKDE